MTSWKTKYSPTKANNSAWKLPVIKENRSKLREIRLLFCVNKWCCHVCHVQTCDETKFNGESRDFHETVISSFSALVGHSKGET